MSVYHRATIALFSLAAALTLAPSAGCSQGSIDDQPRVTEGHQNIASGLQAAGQLAATKDCFARRERAAPQAHRFGSNPDNTFSSLAARCRSCDSA